jgi:regulator of protease activity HflC (stomatin/prohibitin superfamily)
MEGTPMTPLRFVKTPPTTHVLLYRNGQIVRQGAGITVFHAPWHTLVLVPLASADAPFAFQELTADFQTVTIQGRLTYRVADPKKLAGVLNFSVTPDGRYRTDDPPKVPERLTHAAQIAARAVTQRLPLRELLAHAETVGGEILARLREADAARELGVELLGVDVLQLRPTPEMAKALEAEAREALQRRSDEAIYARRNAAVEQERLIKENEMQTELMLQEKDRELRERKMAADVAIEQQRATLIDRRVENDRKDADAHAYTLRATVDPVRDLDWRMVLALAGEKGDPGTTIALAFEQLAANAQKIGELNISPDLLQMLVRREARK